MTFNKIFQSIFHESKADVNITEKNTQTFNNFFHPFWFTGMFYASSIFKTTVFTIWIHLLSNLSCSCPKWLETRQSPRRTFSTPYEGVRFRIRRGVTHRHSAACPE